MSVKHSSIKAIWQQLNQGHQNKAIDLALRYFSKEFDDPELYLEWGKIFEILSLAKKAIESYNLALRFSPEEPRYLKPLAMLLYEIGHLDKSLHIFKKLVALAPKDEEIRDYYLKNLEELGFKGAGEKIRQTRPSVSPYRYFPPTIGKADTEVFLQLFSGRKMGFGELILEEKTYLPELIHKERTIKHQEIEAHILGKKTIFFYPLREDLKAKIGIISMEISKRDRIDYARQPSFLILKREKLKQYAIKSREIITEKFGLSAYLERMNPFGYRLWFFLEEFVHFLQIKRFLQEVMQGLPYPEFGLSVRPLLPTVPVGVGWKEQAILLPLGIDKARGERSLFLNEDGEPHPEQLKFIKKIEELSLSDVKNFIKSGAKKIAPEIEEDKLNRLQQSCPFIDILVKKAEAGRALTHQERVVLFYTLGLMDPAGKALHRVLYPTPDYKYQKVKRILKGIKPNPISCLKIRELLPELAASLECACIFDLKYGRYPSPLLHVNPWLVPIEEERLSLERSSLKTLAKLLVELHHRREETERKIYKLEREIITALSRKGKRDYEVNGIRLELQDGKIDIKRGVTDGHLLCR